MSTASAFGISPCLISKWNKLRGSLFGKNSDTRKIGSGRTEKYPRLEKEVYGWIIKQRNKKLAVKYARIRSHAKRSKMRVAL